MSIVITLIGRGKDKVLSEFSEYQGEISNFRNFLNKVSDNKDRTGTYKIKGE
jgi:hypothetical protein